MQKTPNGWAVIAAITAFISQDTHCTVTKTVWEYENIPVATIAQWVGKWPQGRTSEGTLIFKDSKALSPLSPTEDLAVVYNWFGLVSLQETQAS